MDFVHKIFIIACFISAAVGTGGLIFHKATGEPLAQSLFTVRLFVSVTFSCSGGSRCKS